MDLFNSSTLSLSFSTVPSIREMTTVYARAASALRISSIHRRDGPSRPDVWRRSSTARKASHLVALPRTGCSWPPRSVVRLPGGSVRC